MFATAVACLLLGFVAAICGYAGQLRPDLAVLAQHAFLFCVSGFGVSATAIIFGLDDVFSQPPAAQSADGLKPSPPCGFARN